MFTKRPARSNSGQEKTASPCSLPTHSVQYQLHLWRLSSQNQAYRSRGGADGLAGQGCALKRGGLLLLLEAAAPLLLATGAGPWLAAAGAGPWLAAAANNSPSARSMAPCA